MMPDSFLYDQGASIQLPIQSNRFIQLIQNIAIGITP
jgi:hypothetical protein